MSRLTNTLLRGQNYNRGRDGQSPQIDVSLGAQYGYQPDFGAYVSNTGYTPRNIIPILVEPPRGFRHVPNGAKATAVLKALIEEQAKSITGFNSELTVESSERPIGGAGHQQRDPTNVTEEMSVPNYTWDERYGRPIYSFWNWYIRNLIAEPITKQPGIVTLTDDVEDQLADVYSFTTLYIEPDPLRRHVVEAWLCTNMFPQSTGSLESQLDFEGGQDVPEINVEFAAIPVVSQGVRDFAQSLLDEINYTQAGPMQRPAFLDKIDSDVTSVDQGYRESIAAAADSGIGGE